MKRVHATTHRQVLKRLLKKRDFRQGYQEELDKLRLVDALIGLRQQQGVTQQGLAKRLNVSQPFIAKLERAGRITSRSTPSSRWWKPSMESSSSTSSPSHLADCPLMPNGSR